MKSYIFDLFDDSQFTFKDYTRIQDAEFWTSDKDANLSFKIARQGFIINAATINLYNKTDKSLILEQPMTITNNEARFKMPVDIIKHFGEWSVQVIFNGLHTSPAVSFSVFRKLGDSLPEKIGLLHEWEDLHDEVKDFVAEIEGFTLEEFVALKMGEEMSNLEVNYATRLTGLEQKDNQLTAQLAQTVERQNTETYNLLFPPESINAPKGNGVSDDTQSIQAIFDYCIDGDTVIVPKAIFRLTDTVRIKRAIKLIMQGEFVFDHPNLGLLVKNDEAKGNFGTNQPNIHTLDLEINVSRVKGKDYDFFESCVGVEIWNAYSSYFKIKKIEGNYVGLKLIGNKYGTGYEGTTYCRFDLGIIDSRMYNIVAETANSGYVTQNQFYSGSLRGSRIVVENSAHVFLNNLGTTVINENTFFGVSLEGSFKIGIKGHRANSNHFAYNRYELPSIVHLFHFEQSRFNTFVGGYMSDHMRNGKYSDNVGSGFSHNEVNFIDFRLGSVKYYDKKFYITPNGSETSAQSPGNNGVQLAFLPEQWDIEIIKNGYSESSQPETSTRYVVDKKMLVHLNTNDHFNLGLVFNSTIVEAIRIINPPTHSKSFIISLSDPRISVPIEVSSQFNSLIDLTGGNGVIASGKRYVKCFYRATDNRIYIESYH